MLYCSEKSTTQIKAATQHNTKRTGGGEGGEGVVKQRKTNTTQKTTETQQHNAIPTGGVRAVIKHRKTQQHVNTATQHETKGRRRKAASCSTDQQKATQQNISPATQGRRKKHRLPWRRVKAWRGAA